jgi:hypothetical protein
VATRPSDRRTDTPRGETSTLTTLSLRVDVAAEKNSTLVMPFPVELLRFFDRTPGDTSDTSDTADAATTTAPGLSTLNSGSPPAAEPRLASVEAATAQLIPPQG